MPTQTRTPGTISDVGGGAIAWDNPGNAAAQDASYASAAQLIGEADSPTTILRVTNFGFSIPAGNTINSVSLRVRRHASFSLGDPGAEVVDLEVYEYLSGRVGTNKANATPWPTSAGDQNYSLTVTNVATDINSANFGLEFSASLSAVDPDTASALVDVFEMTVDHSFPLPPPPFPGSGGLNTGGAIFLGMIAQQMGCLLLALAADLNRPAVVTVPGLHGQAAAFAAVGVPSLPQHHAAAAIGAFPAIAGPVERVARAVHPETGVVDRAARLVPAHHPAADQHSGPDQHHPKRQSSTPHLTGRGQFDHRDTS
jgi:hypothetical protein